MTDDGVEWLTYYPRDLESLTLPAIGERKSRPFGGSFRK